MFKNKNLLLFLFLLIIKTTTAQLCEGTTVVLLDSINYNVPVNWQLVFEDDFNGDTLDLSKWQLAVSGQGAADGSGSYNSLNNVVVSPDEFFGENTKATGVCSIIAKKEDVVRYPVSWNHAIPQVTYHFTAAQINTIQKFGYGKYEIRCKIPKGKGIWSAFWTYGETNGEGHEMDVFEFANGSSEFKSYDPSRQDKDVLMNYHSSDNTMVGDRKDYDCGYTYKSDIDYSRDYHTFAVIWNKFEVAWYIDGEFIKKASQWYNLIGEPITIYNIQPTQVVIRNDWFPKNETSIVVDVAIEKSKGVPDETTPFPNSFLIDYIRYYSY